MKIMLCSSKVELCKKVSYDIMPNKIDCNTLHLHIIYAELKIDETLKQKFILSIHELFLNTHWFHVQFLSNLKVLKILYEK